MVRRVDTTISYLEMTAPPEAPATAAPRPDVVVAHAVRPPVHFYRYLYNTVGAAYLWGDRRRAPDEELAAILGHADVEVHVLWVAGVPAGYYELDRRVPPQAAGEIELAYFGLMPDWIGRRLGPFLLDDAIRRAWSYRPTRFWVHTQTQDHPAALPLYQRLGFRLYETEQASFDDPRDLGLL